MVLMKDFEIFEPSTSQMQKGQKRPFVEILPYTSVPMAQKYQHSRITRCRIKSEFYGTTDLFISKYHCSYAHPVGLNA